jgi:hypothetical protein
MEISISPMKHGSESNEWNGIDGSGEISARAGRGNFELCNGTSGSTSFLHTLTSDDPARQFLLICPSTRHGIILEMRNWKRSPRTSFSIFYLKLSHGFARILRCVTEGIWMDSFSIRDRDRVSGSPENVLAQRHFVKSWKLRARRGEPKSSCVVECRIGAPEKGQTIFYVSAQWA